MKFLPAILCVGLVSLVVPAAKADKEPPVPIRTFAPEYPFEMRREGVNGVVTVKVTIDEHGAVSSTEVVKSSNPAFERPAVDAVTKWKFKPAKVDGKAVETKVIVPISFVYNA
jgi:protein TonB